MKANRLPWILALLMLGTAAVAWAMVPRLHMSTLRSSANMAQLIPSEFGEWKEVRQSGRQIVNPQQTVILEEIYSETLSRVYINAAGATVMLSLAYGANQSRDLQVHRPEVCYSAQGFQILSSEKINIASSYGDIKAMNIVAKQGARNEPITYWVRIGEKVVRGNIEQGIARLQYGLSGILPDGILFRVSSIDNDDTLAYKTQEKFIFDLVNAVPQSTKNFLVGEPEI